MSLRFAHVLHHQELKQRRRDLSLELHGATVQLVVAIHADETNVKHEQSAGLFGTFFFGWGDSVIIGCCRDCE